MSITALPLQLKKISLSPGLNGLTKIRLFSINVIAKPMHVINLTIHCVHEMRYYNSLSSLHCQDVM